MKSYDVTELVDFKEQPDGSVKIDPKCPHDQMLPRSRWGAPPMCMRCGKEFPDNGSAGI